MPLSIDAKALGVFVEYTLKPIIEDANDLLDKCSGKPDINSIITRATEIFIVQQITYALTSIIVTGMICLTALYILLNYPNIPR